MELGLLEMLVAKGGLTAMIVSWAAVLYGTATAAIALTRTKKDDNMQAKLEGIPLIGGILKALINFWPKK